MADAVNSTTSAEEEGSPVAAAAASQDSTGPVVEDVTSDDEEDNVVTEMTDAVSSLAVADEPSTPAEAEDDAAPTAPGVEPPSLGPIVQQLPLNLPPNIGNNLAALNDADAAEALDNEFLSLLPPCILPRIDKLKSLNNARDEILEEYRIERAALEMKFMARMAPLYEERKGVVNGQFDSEIAKQQADDPREADDVEEATQTQPQAPTAGFGADVKGIPQFWACAMGHVDVIAELITESDVDCLDHLTDITCTDFPDGLGFELNFHFTANPFFTNTILSKKYEVPNLLTEDEPILKNVSGTEIEWKKNQSLTYREVTKKQRKKGGPNAGQIRTITKKERTESFFHFFTPPKMPALTAVMDEEEADAVEEAFDHDYDVAQAFRGHLIPRAVLWFTGEAMMMDEDLDEAMMEEMMEGDGGGNDGGASGQQFTYTGENPFPPPAAGEGDNPECKQN